MVNLINHIGVPKSLQNQFLNQMDTFLLELSYKSKQFKPVVSLDGIVNQSNIPVLPQPLDSFYIGIYLSFGHLRLMGYLTLSIFVHLCIVLLCQLVKSFNGLLVLGLLKKICVAFVGWIALEGIVLLVKTYRCCVTVLRLLFYHSNQIKIFIVSKRPPLSLFLLFAAFEPYFMAFSEHLAMTSKTFFLSAKSTNTIIFFENK